MMKIPQQLQDGGTLSKYLSPLGAWALAFGCAVGWGAFVMPGTTFLPMAGPLGSVLGLLIGAGIMLLIGVNYHHLMQRYPDAGGSYTFAKNVFGGDHGFLCAWMLLLTYMAIVWANSSALSLIVRYLFGDVFCFGFSYELAGYTVYFGEVLLSVLVLALGCGVCLLGKRVTKWVQIICALLLFTGVLVCFVMVLIHRGGFSGLAPAFSSEGDPATQVIGIMVLAPWAFIGFESISHSAGEFRFSLKKSLPVFAAALITGALVYIMLTLCAALAVPDGFQNWGEYIMSLTRLGGIKGLPTFYAAKEAMGSFGLILLGISAFCGILTGLIANFVAVSRLIHAMSRDNMAPKRLGAISRRGVPAKATVCVAAVSCLIPLLGRTAIGWIVDVTTIGATLVYAYTSISAFAVGVREHRTGLKISGFAGSICSVVFTLFFMLPGIWSEGKLSAESYLILIIWSVLGMIFFRILVQRDKTRRLGKSEIVWIILLVLIMAVSLIWIFQLTVGEADDIARDVTAFQANQAARAGVAPESEYVTSTGDYITSRIYDFGKMVTRNVMVQTLLILVSLAVIFSIFSIIKKREKQIESERLLAEESSKAKSVFLSNMSHDIRTPMNAITGYTALALKEDGVPDNVRGYLEKIDTSGKHLLSLINDILDMSRIESGKMELDTAPADLFRILDEVYDIFVMQMKAKKLEFTVDYSGVSNRYAVCDKNRLNRVLLNLISNACKFTPEGGSVTLTLRQTGEENGFGQYELTVSDTGIGMSPEFAEHVFDAFERERSHTVNRIQGTGLGMSITKSFVELMGGTIKLKTAQGKGTTFRLLLSFELAQESDVEALIAPGEQEHRHDFSAVKLLLAEDNPINQEIATMILTQEGFTVDVAENGKVAADMVAAAEENTYQVILMDVQMPVMNGYDATRAIRALPGSKGKIPVIAITANTFEDDRREAFEAGMNSHVGKPFRPEELVAAIDALL